jgi:Ca2+-binding EF-hand superfamily protein
MAKTTKTKSGTLDDFVLFLEKIKSGHDQINAILTKTNGGEPDPKVNDMPKSKYVISSDMRRNTFNGVSFQQRKKNHSRCPKIHLTTNRREEALSKEIESQRFRLAQRLATMDFPLNACLQALKIKGNNNLKGVCELLLQWFPKGSGSRAMIHSLITVIETSEAKMNEMLMAIKKTMNNGTVTERFNAVKVHFNRCDSGGKGYLTASEFRNLSYQLGVILDDAELKEAILQIDIDGNGQIDIDEYLRWWGDEELVSRHRNCSIGSIEKGIVWKNKEAFRRRRNTFTSNNLDSRNDSQISSRNKFSTIGAEGFLNITQSYLARAKFKQNVASRIGRAIEKYDRLTTVPLGERENMQSVASEQICDLGSIKSTNDPMETIQERAPALERQRRKIKLVRLHDAIKTGRQIIEQTAPKGI